MRDTHCLLDLVPASRVADGLSWSAFHVLGDPAIAPSVWSGVERWSNDGHPPSFVLGVSLGGGLMLLGVLRPTRAGLRVRVELLQGRERLSGVFCLHIAGSSGVVYAGDDDAALNARVRALPRPVLATRSWDEVWVSEQEELGLERLDEPAFDGDDVAVALRSGDRLMFQAAASDIRDALFALAAMGGAAYLVH